jgi:hypothetical protein
MQRKAVQAPVCFVLGAVELEGVLIVDIVARATMKYPLIAVILKDI